MTTLVLDVDTKQKRALTGILKYLQINFREMKVEKDDYVEPTKAEILEGIKHALEEVKLAEAGKIKLKTLDEFLNEFPD